MRDRWNDVALVRPHRIHLDHERVVNGVDEVVVQRLNRNRRCKGAKLLPELDARVDNVAHVPASWIGEDAAIAERAGAPFHPSLEPSDHPAIGNPRRGPFTQLLFARDVRARAVPRLHFVAPCVDGRGGIPVVELRTPGPMTHLEAASPTLPVPYV